MVSEIATAIEAVEKAALIIVEKYHATYRVGTKASGDVVTDVDIAAQDAIVEMIRERFPDHNILAEEGGAASKENPYTWIIDPLDGTHNYCRHLPCFCTSIALSHRGEVILGVVYDPLHDSLFRAGKDGGAFLNGEPLQVSQTGRLEDAVIGFDLCSTDDKKESLRLIGSIGQHSKTLRSFGSAALGLCYVAAGWLDGFFHTNLEPWDAAAGALIVQEAGGIAHNFTGLPWQMSFRTCLATNGRLDREIKGFV